HHSLSQVAATRLAADKQPAIAVALPAATRDGSTIHEFQERLPRSPAASIVAVVELANLVVFRRVDASKPQTLPVKRQTVAIIDRHAPFDGPCRNPIEACDRQGKKQQDCERQRDIARSASSPRLAPPPASG